MDMDKMVLAKNVFWSDLPAQWPWLKGLSRHEREALCHWIVRETYRDGGDDAARALIYRLMQVWVNSEEQQGS